MSIILKPLFEILTGEVAVCDNILLNYVIMLGIGEIAFQAAHSLVGDAYRAGMISGKKCRFYFALDHPPINLCGDCVSATCCNCDLSLLCQHPGLGMDLYSWHNQLFTDSLLGE